MRLSLYDYCRSSGKEYLLSEWDGEKNLPLTPEDVSYGSSARKLWWICESGHSWRTSPYIRISGSGCPYCAGRRVDAGKNDLASLYPELMKQWHPTKNGGLSPKQLSAGSHRRVWWICARGHEWQALVKSRADGAGCPVCANKVVLPGENDLATTHPGLARQWDAEKNTLLTPMQVTSGSRKKVWWRCGRGHSWEAAIASRVRGCGCPVCTGKTVVAGENDLAAAFPDIAAQWHSAKNGALAPEGCAAASNRKVWWSCPLGHEYQASVSSRTVHGSGCPYCAGRKVLKGFNDLATLEPGTAAQWHPTLNGALTPELVTAGSARKVWWQCAQGHVWKAVIHSRTGAKRCGCPVCAGRVRETQQVRYSAILEDFVQSAQTAAGTAPV